ncbi:MAG: preprotein translocase subunit SecE [Ruminococcaceae bacterium]|nr:preprotein translocase subunit SecE [Oscillospiraceae bacterium]
MKAKKSLALFLVSCLILCAFLCLGVSAEDGGESGGISTMALVALIIGGVVLAVAIVLCIVKRKALTEALRAYRREMKNITWYSWKNVWRSTVFVIVAVLATALVVGLLDIAFFEIQYLLTGTGVHFFGGK